MEVLQGKTNSVTWRKDGIKENEHALAESVEVEEGQQEDFVNAGIEGSVVKHFSFRQKGGGTWVNSKKWRIPAKKRKDRDAQYGSKKEDERSLLIDEMQMNWHFIYVNFETNMEEIVAQGAEEITYYEPAFDDLKADTFVLVDIIGNVKLKTHYAYAHEIDEFGGND